MYTLIGLAVVTQTAVVARSAPRVAGAPHGRGLRPEKVVYFVGTDEQAAVVHSRRQRGRTGALLKTAYRGGPHAGSNSTGGQPLHSSQTAANDAMLRQAEVRASFVVGIPSDRSVCIKQVLIEGEAVGGFTPAGKPPPQLLCRSGIRSYGLVCCA